MKYFVIAGEASGDLHASNLMHALQRTDPAAAFTFIGGDLMTEAAGKGNSPVPAGSEGRPDVAVGDRTPEASANAPLFHYKEMNFMGFAAVLANFWKLSSILRHTKKAIRSAAPDAVILVDYAGFNLRIARYAHRKGIRVLYYISPKVWAWRKSRVKALKKYVDRLFVIFPFEVDFFREQGMEVEYHGNPLMDVVHRFEKTGPSRETFLEEHQLDDRPVIALLAGSRRQEINSCLPEMIKAAAAFPGYQFVVAGAPSVDHELYAQHLEGTGIRLVFSQTYPLLSHARAAVVTSGTATLETALLGVPQVVIYKTGALTYRIGKLFVTFRFFSLVNLVLGRELVKEFLQTNLAGQVENELVKILNDRGHQLMITTGYTQIREMLGKPGVADRVAGGMTALLKQEG
ncbi:MAG: lipid-A-disaccharide synthase [Bacteroidales bacterium]|nr:lipid-A-disaccharide synthase [Bacteroidales bacterium]MDT8431214.1 lipid-A-disaccharide synthase [Bacteroidales bacterium]